MIFTESKQMSKAINDAVSFASTILSIKPIPSIEDIKTLEEALLSASPFDVQTEIIGNDDPVGNLRYYLDVFRYSLHLCDIHLPYLSEEALRERLKEEGLQPTSIDRYIEQCYKLIETARGRIEDVFSIFDNIDWVQLRGYVFEGDRVNANAESLRPFFKVDDAFLAFLRNIKGKKGMGIVVEVASLCHFGLLTIKLDEAQCSGEGTLYNGLKEAGFNVHKNKDGWFTAIKRWRENPKRKINEEYRRYRQLIPKEGAD